MANNSNHFRARPSNLTSSCEICDELVPYNPVSQPLCKECHDEATRLMQATNRKDMQYSTSPVPANPSSRRVTFGPDSSFQAAMFDPNEDGEDEFVDAHEEFTADEGQGVLPITSAMDGDSDENYFVMSGQGQEQIGGLSEGASEHDGSVDWSQQAADDEMDLFARAFPSTSGSDVEEHEEEEEYIMEIDGGLKESTAEAKKDETKPAKSIGVGEGDTTRLEKPAPKTPAPSRVAATSGPPGAPDPVKDLSTNFKFLRNFHNRAKELIPRLPLADHRYWIGVLHVGTKYRNFKEEKHFMWMKGNRLTTVATVWHTFQITTAEQEFVLLLGKEKPDPTDKMEQLDYFNDKKVLFRAVAKAHPDAKGSDLSEEFIPKPRVEGKGGACEPIELD